MSQDARIVGQARLVAVFAGLILVASAVTLAFKGPSHPVAGPAPSPTPSTAFTSPPPTTPASPSAVEPTPDPTLTSSPEPQASPSRAATKKRRASNEGPPNMLPRTGIPWQSALWFGLIAGVAFWVVDRLRTRRARW